VSTTNTEIEAKFRSAIATLQEQYHQKSETAPQAELRKLAKEIQAKKQEYMTWLLGDAKPCPVCKVAPHALQKTPAYVRGDGVRMEPIYEIGCIHCWRASRTWNLETCRSMWNAEKFIPEPSAEKQAKVAMPVPTPKAVS
jgi:hypothetical protein